MWLYFDIYIILYTYTPNKIAVAVATTPRQHPCNPSTAHPATRLAARRLHRRLVFSDTNNNYTMITWCMTILYDTQAHTRAYPHIWDTLTTQYCIMSSNNQMWKLETLWSSAASRYCSIYKILFSFQGVATMNPSTYPLSL